MWFWFIPLRIVLIRRLHLVFMSHLSINIHLLHPRLLHVSISIFMSVFIDEEARLHVHLHLRRGAFFMSFFISCLRPSSSPFFISLLHLLHPPSPALPNSYAYACIHLFHEPFPEREKRPERVEFWNFGANVGHNSTPLHLAPSS